MQPCPVPGEELLAAIPKLGGPLSARLPLLAGAALPARPGIGFGLELGLRIRVRYRDRDRVRVRVYGEGYGWGSGLLTAAGEHTGGDVHRDERAGLRVFQKVRRATGRASRATGPETRAVRGGREANQTAQKTKVHRQRQR